MISGYDDAQVANAATIADVAYAWGLGDHGALLGVMCAMGESSLRNIDYGDWETNGVRNPDGTPTTSIGLFQQQLWWGSVPDRMDPFYASWRFLDALSKIVGWRELPPTIAIHRVQINADPNHYAKYENPARAVLAAIPGLRAKGVIMASPFDIIELDWAPGNYGRRVLVEALIAAGRPPVNDVDRLYDDQKDAWDAYLNGTGNPADNPDDPNNYELGHVRLIAADITPTPERVRRLEAAGLVRPFSWESWHWRVAGDVRRWPIVKSIPASASLKPEGFLVALSDQEQENLKNDVADLKKSMKQVVDWLRGDNPDVDRLTEFTPLLRDLYKRIRGDNPNFDNIQDDLGQNVEFRKLLERIEVALAKNNAG